jgi:bifunctional UDP-N-acetylglucosamine pyrophosphorylase/glucosamine-1-phosphate N-acetyltransferase
MKDTTLTAAIVLAAGGGTRMKSATPKVLHAIAGKTLLRRVLESVEELEPSILLTVVRHNKELVSEEARRACPAVCIVEQDEISGTGRAVQCALAALDDSGAIDGQGCVLITASDMPLLDSKTLQAFVDFHEAEGNVASVLTTILENPLGYGRIVRENVDVDGQVERIVEEKDATDGERKIHEVNTSVYIFDFEVLKGSVKNLSSDNVQKEFYLTDALTAAKKFGKVGAFIAPDSVAVEGANDRVQLARLAKIHNIRTCEQWMREGVTILDPQTTWIDDDVVMESDVTVLPGSFLQGKTSVAHDAVIGPYTTLIDAVIDEGATVERSRVEGSHVGAHATIGPWTYMRPGNDLGENTKAGAYVEMKKAVVDAGTKVPHLSYIGDAHLGSNTNIGGGTITANYDGVHKNHTEIGSNVHVGAGNMFVAPVSVGDGVTTGAGAVVRHDVPDDALVFSENTQHVVEDYHK